MDTPELIALARAAALSHNLDPALVCALVEQESAWNPWAVRYEPAFDRRYLVPLRLRPTDEILRAMSWGLMQVMGETARDSGFRESPAKMLDPIIGLDVGCMVLKGELVWADGVVRDALLRWNGGGNPNYPDHVMARIVHYQNAAGA